MPVVIGTVETWLDDSVYNSAVFCGLSYSILGRADRKQAKHGGLLLAIENTFCSSIKVWDLKNSDYFISCVLLSQNFSLGVLLFDLPSRGPKFYLSAVRVQEELQNIFDEFEVFKSSFKSNDSQVLIFGDFNFPDVNWDAHMSKHSDEQFLLDYLCQDLLLEQIIRSSTHKRGNILDLVFVSHFDLWDFDTQFLVLRS